MDLKSVVILAHGHFWRSCPNYQQQEMMVDQFANEECIFQDHYLKAFLRQLRHSKEVPPERRELERFFTWYFINFVVDFVVDDLLPPVNTNDQP